METDQEEKWNSGDNPRYRWLCERARAMGLEDDEWEDCSDDEEDDTMEQDQRLPDIETAECLIDGKNQREIPLTECFFSGFVSATVEDNLAYMEREFGFFIPCKENLIDRDGLL